MAKRKEPMTEIAPVDDRGRIVIYQTVRNHFKIKPGDFIVVQVMGKATVK